MRKNLTRMKPTKLEEKELNICIKKQVVGKTERNDPTSCSGNKDSNNLYVKIPTTSPGTTVKETDSKSVMGYKEPDNYEEGNMLNMYGVRIRPSVVIFKNTFENQSCIETVSVQNISENSVTIRIHKPRSLSFRVTPLDRGYLLAPGLKISRRIHYMCTRNCILNSTLFIYVNENVIELPLEAYKGQAFVEIIPTSIKFGRIDVGCKPVERTILIKNMSFCATKFFVDVGYNELDLHVGPKRGWIHPHSSTTINLQLFALREGVQSCELWITTDLSHTRIHMEVEACRRQLMVLHPNTISDFTLVDFPVTFYGCRRYQTVVVYNLAASSSAFVVLADFGSKGLKPFKEAQKGVQENVKMFDVDPVEGRIRPFEKRIFTFWFNPIITESVKKSDRPKSGDVNDYLCAVRINRIQFDDFGADLTAENGMIGLLENKVLESTQANFNLERESKTDSQEGKESLVMPMTQDISVLLYLYGEAEIPSMSVTPDTLHFPGIIVGNTVVKVVQLTNNSNQPLAFKYSKIPFFEVLPDFKILGPKKSYDVTVKLYARNLSIFNRNLIFEILAQSNATDKLNLHVVNQVTVKILGKVKSEKRIPEPRFNPGITPIITHEVGFLTDDVTFTSKAEKPRCALTAAAQRDRPWHLTDATIAFPNDRPLTLRPRPTDATAKTIYKGIARYVPPVDESLTYTIEGMIEKKAHDDWFLSYIRGTAAMSVSKNNCCKWKNSKPDPDPPVIFEDKQPNVPREVFVPLTFVQLYRIKVYPAIISFGSVTTSKNCTQVLSVENSNNFQISARVIPLTSGIKIQTLENFIISENSETKVTLTFKRGALGKYSGTITCIINGYHSFDIAVVAEVVHRSLTIMPEHVEIKIPQVPFASMFVPLAINNPLNIPITFSWLVPEESPVKIEPIVGVTPKLTTVWCVAFFKPESPNYKLHPIKLMVEGTTCLQLKTGIVLPKTNVYFLEPVLNVGYISINVTTVKRFMIFNPDFYDAMFVVLNKEPISGVKVKPTSGTIKGRSCHSMTLHMTVTSEKELDFTIYITLQNSVTIEMKVIGTVVYPHVEVTPRYVNLQRVPCNSVTRTILLAENKSKTKAEVSFEMEEYPQFKVSLSKRHHDPALITPLTLDPGAVQKFYLHFFPKDLASYDFYLPITINNLFTDYINNKDMEVQARLIKCLYKSRSSSTKRSCTKTINVTAIMSHLVVVDVVVIKPAIVISELELFFYSTSDVKSFTVKNVSEQTIGIIIRCEDDKAPFDFDVDIEEAVWDISAFKVTIVPGGCVTYNTTFTATSPGSYVSDVSILSTFEDRSCTYTTVRLIGNISLPFIITSSVNEIYFQPVPLNLETSFLLYLKIRYNDQKATVNSFEIIHSNTELFNVEYPNGNTISGINKTTIPVKIIFQSAFPISLRNKITFRGAMNSQCTIALTATADNCLVTTHGYLKAHSLHRPKLKVLEEPTDKLTPTESEKSKSPKQRLLRETTLVNNDSSSENSEESAISLKTICTINQPYNMERSNSLYSNRTRSINTTEKERNPFLNSDMMLSIQLSEKEEEQPSSMSLGFRKIITIGEEEMIFPMFPLESAVSEYSVHMHKSLDAVQQWVYEQVFCCSYNPVFGSHSFASFSLMSRKDYSHSSPVVLKNVFDALERICGRRIRRFFTPIDKLPDDMTASAVFTYNLYRQLVDFMVAQGALMAHVDPKYLMVYEEYCLYQKTMPKVNINKSQHELSSTEIHFSDDHSTSELLSVERFYRISIQCWLDLFLQIFKTLVLAPAVGITSYVSHEGSRQPTHDFDIMRSVYGRSEEILMTWLAHQYNTQRTVVWPKRSPPPRTISNFDTDLEDGLVLTATTAAYCPYLNQIHFHDMFVKPTTISEAYHNTTCLCMAWDTIKLGFSVTPQDFEQPNTIKMLLLVTHLYKILPSYKPEATLTFKALLNASDNQIVTLENDEDVSITYHVGILPHNINFFVEECKNTFVLKRKSTEQITVQYKARNTNKAEAILLLCGACMPPKFGRNYVFKLEGYPVKLPVSSSFNIVSPQNTPVNTQITVESPHALDFKECASYSYDLWIAYAEPQPGNLNALCWSKERRRKIPHRVFFPSNTLTIYSTNKQNGSGELAFKVCCFTQITSHYWLIFRNQEIGDFIVKLQITPHLPASVMNIWVPMSSDSKCTCEADRSYVCSRFATVNVPCRNLEQWAAIRTMFELTISDAEKEFWATYIESNIGFRLLQWMSEEKEQKFNRELEMLFKKSKTFKVSCPSKYISCVPTLHIPDVRSKSLLPVQIHCSENISSFSTVLNITSMDGDEVRRYNLKIVCDDQKSL